MKSSILKIFFILIFSFIFPNTFAQEKPEAILIDKFGLLNCEDIWARQDAFFVEIQNSPTSIAYAVIYGKKNATRQNLAREKLIAGFVKFRKFDKARLKIVRGKESNEPHTEFWLVPAGADKPDFDEVEWDLTFPTNQKPFIYYSSNEDDDICPSGWQLKIYSDYLTKNPKARANIVIYAKSTSEFQKQSKDFLDELGKNYNIPPKRIRFFFVKEKTDYKSYELWLLP